MKMMKILFIRPNMTNARSSDALEPLAFAVLSGLTPPDVEKVFLDERLEPIDDVSENLSADLVALSVETFTARRAYELADGFRKRGVPVVMGGYHPTLLPEEALEHADAVAVGDAEDLWPQIVEDARQNQLKRLYRSEHPPSLEGVRYDRSLFRGKRYAPIKPVQFGRGCKFSCDFCSIHAFYGKSIRQRPVPEVIEEIRALGSKSLFFVDDNLFADETRIRELLEALVPLKVKWGCQISIDVTEDSSLLRLMQKSGCQCVQIGFESLNSQNLGLMKKTVNLRQGDYHQALARLRAHGIMVYGTFILGYDHDAAEIIPSTVDFALKHRFFLANFNPLMTMPGTPLYRRLQEEGSLLFDRWWVDPDFRYGQAMLRPKGMTPEQLTEGCLRARLRFNRVSSLLLRSIDLPNRRDLSRMGLFWAANWISRKEILAKQGISLG